MKHGNHLPLPRRKHTTIYQFVQCHTLNTVVLVFICATNWYLIQVCQKDSATLWENVPEVNLLQYNKTYLYPKLNGYRDNDMKNAVPHTVPV